MTGTGQVAELTGFVHLYERGVGITVEGVDDEFVRLVENSEEETPKALKIGRSVFMSHSHADKPL